MIQHLSTFMFTLMTTLLKLSTSLLVVFLSSVPFAFGQDTWPNRPIKLIVPFQAGSATDVAARVISSKLSTTLNLAVVIDN